MKYKPFICSHILLIITAVHFTAAADHHFLSRLLPRNAHTSGLERLLPTTDTVYKNPRESALPRKDSQEDDVDSATDFPSQISRCLAERRNQITGNFVHGKHVIVNCFKTVLMLYMLRRLGESSKSSIKLFNGLVELKKIPEMGSDECGEGLESCEEKYDRDFQDRKSEYVRMYKKALEKLIYERRRLNGYRNQTQEENAAQLERINENSQAFLSEVVKTLRDENMERAEEEKLKREVADPRLLSVLDTFSKNYLLKVRFYPGVAARMKRSHNGGFTFDLEIQDRPEEVEEEMEEEGEDEMFSDEGSTREIKDGPQGKDYFGDDDDDSGSKKKWKDDKKKKKKLKKKAKKLKKIIPYLLLPMLIQLSLLPFVFKKLFFLAMKALLAGKMALILVGFNILRNTCIKNEDDYQKIRVEHYGYRRGEEYGAWVNGRALPGPSVMAALSEEPFRGWNPLRGKVSS